MGHAGPLEENARQAVRAAASILKAAARMNDADPQLDTQVQIGANAGAAFVGITRFLTRRGERWTYTASGPVTNVAARLCALAGPGATAVSADVVKLVGGRLTSRASESGSSSRWLRRCSWRSWLSRWWKGRGTNTASKNAASLFLQSPDWPTNGTR